MALIQEKKPTSHELIKKTEFPTLLVRRSQNGSKHLQRTNVSTGYYLPPLFILPYLGLLLISHILLLPLYL